MIINSKKLVYTFIPQKLPRETKPHGWLLFNFFCKSFCLLISLWITQFVSMHWIIFYNNSDKKLASRHKKQSSKEKMITIKSMKPSNQQTNAS